MNTEIAEKIVHEWLSNNPSQSLLGVGTLQQSIADALGAERRAAFERAIEILMRQSYYDLQTGRELEAEMNNDSTQLS